MSLSDVPLSDLADEVLFHGVEQTLLNKVRERSRSVYKVARDLIDHAEGPKTIGRFIDARDQAEHGMDSNRLSSALMALCRAEAKLANTDDVKHRARRYLVSVLPAVDALAILGREES